MALVIAWTSPFVSKTSSEGKTYARAAEGVAGVYWWCGTGNGKTPATDMISFLGTITPEHLQLNKM